LAEPAPPTLAAALDDMTGQRIALLPPGFVAATGADRLADIVRYLRAIERRLDDLAQGSPRDRERMAAVQALEHRYGLLIDRAVPDGSDDAALERIGWMIEELRVSLFAQSLGTPEPISATRITRAMAELG
jgi:ATP-dependent helicase HrpA